MKICPACKIEIDGNPMNCPFCQNSLSGEPSSANWPEATKFKKHALLFKLQLFIVLVLILVTVFLDFVFDLNNGLHYSTYAVIWGSFAEILTIYFIKRHTFPAKIVTICSIVFSILASVTAYSLGSELFSLIFYIITPGVIGANIITNLVFALTDKRGDSMIYLFATLIVGVLPYIALRIDHDEKTLAWSICMLISIIVFLAIIIFKGKSVASELQKRFNF